MRFLRLRIAAFGPLVDRDFELNPNRVLVHGANTTGKTSFREALETVLYGFDPARRETHPLWIWNEGDDLHLEADLEPGDGAPFRLERTLQTTGKHRRAAIGEEFTGSRKRNTPLPETSGAARAMFRAVYGLSLDDLSDFDAVLSEDIDRLLLPTHQGVRLRASRDVMRELEGEHAGMWHRDKRRGKVAQQIADDRRTLRRDLKAALDSEDALREANAELIAIKSRLPKIDEERRTVERETREASSLEEIFEWRRQVAQLPERPDLTPLGQTGLEDPRRLRSEIDAGEKEIAPHRERLLHEPVELAGVDRRVLDRADAIDAIELGRHEDQCDEFEKNLDLSSTTRRELTVEMAGLLVGPPGVAGLELLREVSLDALEAAVDDWTQEAAQQAADRSVDAGRRWAGLGLLSAGVTLLATGTFVAGLEWLATIGGLLAGAGGVIVWLARDSVKTRRAVAEAPATLREALGPLPVEPAMLATPQAARELNRCLRERSQKLARLDGLESRIEDSRPVIDDRVRGWKELIGEIEIELQGGGSLLADKLRSLLARAREAESEVRKDTEERTLAQKMIDARGPALERTRSRWEAVVDLLSAAVAEESDPGAAYDRLTAREELRRRLEEHEARLRSDPAFEELLGRLPGDPTVMPDPVPWNDDVVDLRGDRLAGLKRERDDKLQRRGELEQLLRDARGSESARIREQLDALDRRSREIRIDRDRLAMLERILGEADRLYRQEHQPDVLRNANRYLETVTGGSMKRLEYGGDEGGVLQVTPDGRDEPVLVAAPLSRGTRDQIHLCLRLGLLDHLDSDGETLPLILDEVLVNWDAARRACIYPLLKQVSETRQVFVLTCHEAFAAEAERELGIERIEL